MFNDQQLDAINSNSRLILVLSAAGVGKTQTMVGRICRLIHDGVDPKRILTLTFTNAGGFAMKERYKQLMNDISDKATPEFRTFHGFCYSLLVKDKAVRAAVGYSKIPEICDDKQMKKLREEVKLQTNCKLSDSMMENPLSLTQKEKYQLDNFNKQLKKRIMAENVITFDMLCYDVCQLFVDNAECIQKYKQKYTHVLCDEFQDTDPKQFKFLASFPETTSMFYVGDAQQSIYAFRGCSNEYIKMLSADPDWEVIRLYKNYRSSRQICDYANAFSVYAKPEYRIEMEGQFEGEPVHVMRYSQCGYNNPVDIDHLNDVIKHIKENPEIDSAILCRTNKEVGIVCSELQSNGISFTRSNKETDTLSILDSVLSDDYFAEWIVSLLPPKEYSDYVRLSAQSEEPLSLQIILSKFGHIALIEAKSKKVFEIRDIMSDESLTVQDKFDKVTGLLRIKSKVKFDYYEDVSDDRLIEHIKTAIEEKESTNLYAGTIHSSKGLEYERVFVLGVDDGMFKLDNDEMRNLFYVAITRPKKYLYVYKK